MRAIGSVDFGIAMWIVVDDDAPMLIGGGQRGAVPVFAARAEPAKASVAAAVAATSPARIPFLICGCPFVFLTVVRMLIRSPLSRVLQTLRSVRTFSKACRGRSRSRAGTA